MMKDTYKLRQEINRLAKESPEVAEYRRLLSEETETRMRQAKIRAAEMKKKEREKIVKVKPRLVAEYLDAMNAYRKALPVAIAGAERDRFDPHAWGYIKTKHNNIKKLMDELEQILYYDEA